MALSDDEMVRLRQDLRTALKTAETLACLLDADHDTARARVAELEQENKELREEEARLLKADELRLTAESALAQAQLEIHRLTEALAEAVRKMAGGCDCVCHNDD